MTFEVKLHIIKSLCSIMLKFKQKKNIEDCFPSKSDLMHGTFNKLWGQDTFYENIASL